MRMRLFLLALTALSLIQIGCAAGFHVGGERTGLGVSGSLAHDPLLEPSVPPPPRP